MLSTIIPNLDKLLTIAILISTSVIMRYTLTLAGQTWIKTYAHTATLTLLPVVTYVITSVISGNIALSLGMVGALSIVRFRNPVKSPLELAIYFSVITMGITASVSLKWFFLFFIAIHASFFTLYIINLISTGLFNKHYFQVSFSEGNQLSTLEITSQGPLDLKRFSKYIQLERRSEKENYYILASSEYQDLSDIYNEISELQNIINIQIKR
jgi:hypothetical protein